MVSEFHSAYDRGRLPAHEVKLAMETSLLLLQAKARAGSHRFVALQLGFFPDQATGSPVASRSYCNMISEHYMSYDRFSRPFVNYELPKVFTPSHQFSKYMYYMMTGFWPEQVQEICRELRLLPDVIRCRRSGCKAGKEMAIFLLLRRWHIAGKWELVSKDMRQQRSWCILIYHEIFRMLAQYYRKCVRVLDYRRINPLLEEWGQQMAFHRGTDPHVLFFTDGKPWKMSRPGKGQAVRQICEYAGCGDINLMQRAYYNGHYKYHGGKVQHVLQADGMVHSFTCPIRNHDALVLRNSSMHLMLSALYVNGDADRPALTVTDKAYGRTPHFRPHHTEAERRMMPPAARIVAEEFDRIHRTARLAVEDSFAQQVTKFPHADWCRSHKITQGGI